VRAMSFAGVETSIMVGTIAQVVSRPIGIVRSERRPMVIVVPWIVLTPERTGTRVMHLWDRSVCVCSCWR
jgi:hypothetical protein